MGNKKSLYYSDTIYSFSALMAYAAIMLVITLLSFFTNEINLDKVATAVGTGGFFLIVGDLLISVYHLNCELHKICDEYIKVSDILFIVHTKNPTEIGNYILNSLKDENEEIRDNEKKLKNNISAEKILYIIGWIFIVLGFLSLLVLLITDDIFLYLNKSQPYFTIISFFVLIIGVLIK